MYPKNDNYNEKHTQKFYLHKNESTNEREVHQMIHQIFVTIYFLMESKENELDYSTFDFNKVIRCFFV